MYKYLHIGPRPSPYFLANSTALPQQMMMPQSSIPPSVRSAQSTLRRNIMPGTIPIADTLATQPPSAFLRLARRNPQITPDSWRQVS
jgi:hypothetical protein